MTTTDRPSTTIDATFLKVWIRQQKLILWQLHEPTLPTFVQVQTSIQLMATLPQPNLRVGIATATLKFQALEVMAAHWILQAQLQLIRFVFYFLYKKLRSFFWIATKNSSLSFFYFNVGKVATQHFVWTKSFSPTKNDLFKLHFLRTQKRLHSFWWIIIMNSSMRNLSSF